MAKWFLQHNWEYLKSGQPDIPSDVHKLETNIIPMLEGL
jgi:hypothetical protein